MEGAWKQALRKCLLGIEGESPRQHSARETITFPAEIFTGLFGLSFVNGQKAFIDLQAVGVLEEILWTVFSKCTSSIRTTEPH